MVHPLFTSDNDEEESDEVACAVENVFSEARALNGAGNLNVQSSSTLGSLV